MTSLLEGFGAIVIIIVALTLIAICPIISIWALNTLLYGTLFVAEIPLNLYTYLAMLWCSVIIAGVVKCCSGSN